MKKKIIIGNWKMHPLTSLEAEKWFSVITKSLSAVKNTEVVICPPFLYIDKLNKIAERNSRKVSLGAQDSFGRDIGPFTGEVSSEMIRNSGAKYVILGHSERRSLGESDELINKKIKDALFPGLTPILCVGETTRDENHEYFSLVKKQIEECLSGIPKVLISKIIIAYEPVWALSSSVNRKDATSTECREMAIFIRKVLADKFGKDAVKARIIYGGSVNERDVEDFLKNGGVDGVLPGKASLDPKKFIEIVKICEALKS